MKTEKLSIYNTAPEIGTRILCILDACSKHMSLLRIQLYDHFVLHMEDAVGENSSLHPSNPSHASEIFAKQKAIIKSIDYMAARGLISIMYSKNGIYYAKTSQTKNYIECLQSEYAKKLRQNARVISIRYDDYTDLRLRKSVYKNMQSWSGEIEKYYLGEEQKQ